MPMARHAGHLVVAARPCRAMCVKVPTGQYGRQVRSTTHAAVQDRIDAAARCDIPSGRSPVSGRCHEVLKSIGRFICTVTSPSSRQFDVGLRFERLRLLFATGRHVDDIHVVR